MFSLSDLHTYRFVLYMIIGIVLVWLICDWCNRNNRQYSIHVRNGLNDIVRESSKTATAAKQNENYLLAVMANSEALGMLKALRMIAPDTDLQHLTGNVPIVEMERAIVEQQSDSARNLIKQCEHVLPESRLAELAKLYPFAPESKGGVRTP